MSSPRVQIQEIDEDLDYQEETILERIVGLQEALPAPIRKAVSFTTSATLSTIKFTLKYGSKAVWVIASSAVILLLPSMYEESNDSVGAQEAALEESRRMQQQLLMGGPEPGPRPGANIPGMPPAPQMN